MAFGGGEGVGDRDAGGGGLPKRMGMALLFRVRNRNAWGGSPRHAAPCVNKVTDCLHGGGENGASQLQASGKMTSDAEFL